MNRRRYKPALDRGQTLLLPERVEDYVGENHRVRALDAYVDTLDPASMGFMHTEAGTTAGQPPYNPWAMLKLASLRISAWYTQQPQAGSGDRKES